MRELRQQEAVDSWINGKRNSILFLSPRTGKSRIGLNIINQENFPEVLITYPNSVIKKAWEAEIQKVGLNKGSKITYSGILSLKNMTSGNFSLLILDEIHSLSEAQIEAVNEFKRQNPKCLVLGLTGSLSRDTEDILRAELGMDVCYRYTLDQAVKEGVVADYRVEVVTVPLDNQQVTIYSRGKKRTEKQQFDHLSSTIRWMELSDKPTFWLRLARMRVIQNSISKLEKTKELLSTERSLIFCGTTKIADKLGCDVYHAKKGEKGALEKFCKGDLTNLAVCKMLNMGITIKDLDRVVLNYFSSNEETFIQQINRAMNYEYAGKVAKITIISSNEEVELNWLRKALKSLDPNKISYT